jgi:hypothetical protein
MQEHGTAALAEFERECAEGRTAPRIGLSDIESNIALISYAMGSDLAARDRSSSYDAERERSLDCLTICLIQLQNGFSIIGKSAPADPANFDPELGRKLAYDDAIKQIWPLMGYALREKLAGR